LIGRAELARIQQNYLSQGIMGKHGYLAVTFLNFSEFELRIMLAVWTTFLFYRNSVIWLGILTERRWTTILYPESSLYRVPGLEPLQVQILDVVDEPGSQWQTSLTMQRKGRDLGRLA